LAGARPGLSIVVPAYNEQARLPTSLAAIHGFLSGRTDAAEVIVVDDGSEDATATVAEERQAAMAELRVIRNPHRGKAYAVRTGVLASQGEVVFVCDADLSMPIEEVARFLPLIAGGKGVVIGSREAPGARRYGEPPYRHLMGRVFNYLVRIVALREFQDTQCGFKCFTRQAAFDIFPRLQVRTDEVEVHGPMVTGFDVEVLYLARKLGYPIAEIGIDWYYAPGTKVSPVRDALRMVADLIKVRINDRRGLYDIARTTSPEVTRG